MAAVALGIFNTLSHLVPHTTLKSVLLFLQTVVQKNMDSQIVGDLFNVLKSQRKNSKAHAFPQSHAPLPHCKVYILILTQACEESIYDTTCI